MVIGVLGQDVCIKTSKPIWWTVQLQDLETVQRNSVKRKEAVLQPFVWAQIHMTRKPRYEADSIFLVVELSGLILIQVIWTHRCVHSSFNHYQEVWLRQIYEY